MDLKSQNTTDVTKMLVTGEHDEITSIGVNTQARELWLAINGSGLLIGDCYDFALNLKTRYSDSRALGLPTRQNKPCDRQFVDAYVK